MLTVEYPLIGALVPNANTGRETAIWMVPIPPECTVQVAGHHYMTSNGQPPLRELHMLRHRAMVFEVPDPGETYGAQYIWDLLAPQLDDFDSIRDTADDILNRLAGDNTEESATKPDYHKTGHGNNLVDLADLFGIDMDGTERKMLDQTMVLGALDFPAFISDLTAAGKWRYQLRQQVAIAVSRPAQEYRVLVYALSNGMPGLGSEATDLLSARKALVDDEWWKMQYLGELVDSAFRGFLGLEADTADGYADTSLAFLQQVLDPAFQFGNDQITAGDSDDALTDWFVGGLPDVTYLHRVVMRVPGWLRTQHLAANNEGSMIR